MTKLPHNESRAEAAFRRTGLEIKFYRKEFQGMSEIKNGSIDIVFTSPPYKKKDGYSDNMMVILARDLKRVLAQDGIIFLNFGSLAHNKDRPLKVALILGKFFDHYDTIIWAKNFDGKGQFTPGHTDKRISNIFEFIFVFVHKGHVPILDRLSIGVPYTDKSNIGRYSDKDLRCRGNIWPVRYKTIRRKSQKLHSERFPVELVEMGIKLANKLPGSNFLDPFNGSGSSMIACIEHDMNFFGYEIDEQWYDVAITRFEEWWERRVDDGE